MRKAKIVAPEVCDRLAMSYMQKGQGGTIIEVPIKTGAAVGSRVKLDGIGAERNIVRSRWINSVPVVHCTAAEWTYLRGLEISTDAQIRDALQIAEPEPTTHPASHAKTRSKPPASASK